MGGIVENIGGVWKVKCKACSAERADALPVIDATMDGCDMMLKPASYLATTFDAYRMACTGARYDSSRRVNLAPMALAAGILAALVAAKFVVNLSPETAANIQAYQSNARGAMADADARAIAVDADLKTRGLALFAFQRPGIKWLASRDCALLADDQGLGKTCQTLIALPANAAVLVVGPAVAKGVWVREAAKWRPEFNVTVLDGRGSFRAPQRGEIVITNYDILGCNPLKLKGKASSVCEVTLAVVACHVIATVPCASIARKRKGKVKYVGNGLFKCVHGQMTIVSHRAPFLTHRCPVVDPMAGVIVVADEAHNLKNDKTARSKHFVALANPAREGGGKVWLLTATPILNRPQELWTLLEAAGIAQEAFGGWKAFARIFDGTKGAWGGWEWGSPDALAIAPKLAGVMLRRTKKEVLLDLPEKVWSDIVVDIDVATAALLDEVDGKEIVAAIEAGESLNFKKLSAARAALAKAKIPAMLEVVESYEEQAEPLVVFSAHLAPIDVLAKREGWAIITGATSPDKRTEIEAAFQAGMLRGVGCTIKAGGIAITLTRAANMLFVDKEWTPKLNLQAEDRIYRIGQNRGVQIISLVGDHPIDHRIAELCSIKDAIVEASVEAARTTTAPIVTFVEVDFAAIDAAAREEAAKSQVAIDAAQARADEFQAHLATLTTEERDEALGCGPKGKRGGKGGKGGAKAKRVYVPVQRPGCRQASSEQEQWAAMGLRMLADLDPDMARSKNDVGFNAPDAKIGHMLAADANAFGLTDDDWTAAIAVCGKYHRQIGKKPDAAK